MSINLTNIIASVTELCAEGPAKEYFTFCLDSAAEIHGLSTYYSTHIKVLTGFDSSRITTGFNFIDRHRFPDYEDSDFEVVDGFKVTSLLRTLLDLLWDGYDECALQFIDDLRLEISAEEIIDYFKKKRFIRFL